MLKKFVRIFGGDPIKREIERDSEIVAEINRLEPLFEKLSDGELAAKTVEFRQRLATALEGVTAPDEINKAQRQTLDEILPEAFAAVREASKRTIGLRHYDVQLIGGIALHQGKIAEMRTGEGKTLVATLPLYLNALTGRGVHLITVNDYLARRDARWMAPIYTALGMTVGVLQMAARTENGKKAFVVDLTRESPHEDQHHLRMTPRADAYAADITYGTNSEFGFDYLRDNMTMRLEDRVQRGHYYAIIDEVDNILIDEARTPLIISGPAQDEGEWYIRMAQVVKALRPEDYEINEKDRSVTLTEIGEAHVEEILGVPLRDPERPEDVTLEQARLLGYLEQALRAQFLYHRNKEYLVVAGKVVIIDEFTGRLMPGRRWSDGLHQAVEAKEGVRVESESVTYATITIQNYFRMYTKLAGMTGTALTEAEEFSKIYNLDVLAIPTNLEYMASRPDSTLVEVEARDEQGYKYAYYARKDDPEKKPVFWKRKDYPDVVYRTQEIKLRAIAREILHYHVLGRPVLVGTTSVELSERVSNRLRAEPLRRLAQALLIRQAWFDKNQREEDGRLIPELQFLNQPLEKLDVSELRRLCRELGIPFNPEDPSNLPRLLQTLDLGPEDRERLVADLQAGIPHQVLNARKHTEESQIIAGAGAYGAVTIATNMAGRGVDIKLGGELAEEILAAVNRVLRRTGVQDPFDLTLEERRRYLQSLDASNYGIYEAEIQFFLQHMEDMDKVRQLGGLHVIGSERHEARRIDNQLRGRSARQGDPGSSRFYLSMEDDLMRLFGGQQADSLMQRLKIDDSLPLEMGLVSRIVEQSQTRVEGANFDVRKHLLEYDDVLNTQRAKIYGQRNRIFTKEDLSDDVLEMLRIEVNRRVPESLKDAEGPWKLLAWLDQVQPPILVNGDIFPSFTINLLAEDCNHSHSVQLSRQEALESLSRLAERCLDAERDHVVLAIQHLLSAARDRLEQQIDERFEAVDTFLEGLEGEDETDTRRPVELAAELSNIAQAPIKLSIDQQRALRTDPKSLRDAIRQQIISAASNLAVSRLLGAVERRLEEPIEVRPSQTAMSNWDVFSDLVMNAVESWFLRRKERFLGNGSGGLITNDLAAAIDRMGAPIDRRRLLHLLLLMPQGTRAAFDRRTHRRVMQRTNRLNYLYYAARLLDDLEPAKITADVLDHLENAFQVMLAAWGRSEAARLANLRLQDLDDKFVFALESYLEEDFSQTDPDTPLISLPGMNQAALEQFLGRRVLTETYRRLMLDVITSLWVDYLTQMEALRVSIGLEAYAQRDPLVQYKNKAYDLFQNLLSNMRLGVVSRMFNIRPPEQAAGQALPPSSDRLSAAASAEDDGKESPSKALTESEGSGLEDSDTPETEILEEEEVGSAGAQVQEPRALGGGKKRRRRKR